ncbi:SRPBCC family protein [Candidatus Oleimmundimicrobium sp.]|uniref:type II toxin-antitoxin system RatA family toxin n=1 Tax=Candidatus Oleimmundimicrobium sp. TaxID=3060597 RepID=UPI0027178F2C|nr:SRPBCC family protein [Candidatus Oleimmundimicrobium sp.]MDO8885990.1 SRPBCC family protein [Candidatus Oleimmundimicrobium sp.]
MPCVKSSIEIKAPKKDVYKLAKNMESFPSFMRDVKEVKVVKEEKNKTVTEWATEIDDIALNWTEEEWFDDENCLIKYKLIEGDLDKFEGEWKFEEIPEGTRLVLTVDFDFGMPNMEDLIGPVLELKVKENSEMMLEGMKKKMEGSRKVKR